MSFLGYLIALLGIGISIAFIIYIFKEVCYKTIYKETYLPKKYERDLCDKVRWIAIKSYMGSIGSHRTIKEVRDRELYEYIEKEQCELNVEKKFCIDFSNEKEKDFVCKILNIHKQNKIESFFYNSLTKDKALYQLNYLEYYMFGLQGFLKENVHNEFNNILLYKFFRKDGSYTTHKLTDYGVIYQKLYYITTLFCVNNENIKPLFTNSTHTLNGIKENLESGEITFWTYRP